MIAVVDSGSTKSDWVILNEDKTEHLRLETLGLNPYFVDEKTIAEELSRETSLFALKDQISHVYFYGAGCSSKDSINIVKNGLQAFFTQTKVFVNHDLLGAAYASYYGEPAIVCILGTGSNACFFDGVNLRSDSPSLGYILGDDGSGNHLGRELLRAYYQKQLPKEVMEDFDREFSLTLSDVMDRVYKENFPNRFLASFSKFIFKHRENPFIKNMIYDSLQSFFLNQVLTYPEASSSQVNFIGSVAYYYRDILQDVANDLHLSIGYVIEKPIDRLISYHTTYLM